MANGRPKDYPITDLLIHGTHPFPAELEVLIRRLAHTLLRVAKPSSLCLQHVGQRTDFKTTQKRRWTSDEAC